MLTPKELYEAYSISPCGYYYNGSSFQDNGRGSPYDLNRIIRFLKHVKYPCYNSIDTSEIDGTGNKQLALTFKFLQTLDIDAFAEGQPQIESGTAYSVRNAADITRACYLYANNNVNGWQARMATEYLEHFCGNSLPDCLMMLGPDLVEDSVAYNDRAPSTLGCFYLGAGSRFFCYSPPLTDASPICVCGVKPVAMGDGPDPCELDPDDPCCKSGVEFENLCCKVGRSSRIDFSYIIPTDDMSYSSNINNVYFSNTVNNIQDVETLLESDIDRDISINDALVLPNQQVWVLTNGYPRMASSYQRRNFILKHIGILERKDYAGYANFVSPGGKNFNATLDDIFLEHFRDESQHRCKTISTILDIQKNKTSISTNTTGMLNSIKDLIYNGYGIVLLSNVGFPNFRDSTGLSYPDRIWYQTYTIIGYDDRKVEFPECVYVVSCPFGDWIEGGHPSWGPLPPGCFLVTESHLRCMISFYPGMDFYDCRKRFCNPVLYDCEDPSVRIGFDGCGAPEEGKCTPYYCTEQQSAFGMVFAISMNDGFPKQNLPHADFYPISAIRESFKEQEVYFDASA
jgi:hypothetical protein